MGDVQVLDAMTIFQAHMGVVEDVAWHSKHEYMFGSVGDDKQLLDRVGGSSLGADLAAKEEREQVRTTRTRALRKITALSSLTPCSPSRLTGTTP